MPDEKVIAVDLAQVWADTERGKLLATLAWGDAVLVEAVTDSHVEVKLPVFTEQQDGTIAHSTRTGFIKPTAKSRIKPSEVIADKATAAVLMVDFVDVQQGDGAVIETPGGRTILVDGGDNQLFARHLASRFRNTTLEKPKPIDCILVSHGDADHFSGLTEIFKSETHTNKRKRIFIQPDRVYHNGIVKRPESVSEKKRLGSITTKDGELFVDGLVDSLLPMADTEMNDPFKAWKKALTAWNDRRTLVMRRLGFGDHDAFDFLAAEDIRVEVLAPLVETVGGKPALKFLKTPADGPRPVDEVTSTDAPAGGGLSASHTINGHSIVFRLAYGAFSFLFAGDLNDEAGRMLTRQHNSDAIKLTSEVFKVPHHGSADFSGAFIKAVSPLVSVVSSGDESERKEYIHPRATLLGALGRFSRLDEPLIFITELVAFFKLRGWSKPVDAKGAPKGPAYFGFSRTAYGIVMTRTNGRRLMVYTNSGKVAMKEVYAFKLDDHGSPVPDLVRWA